MVSDRPARSIAGRTVIGPASGGRRKYVVSARTGRSPAATAIVSPRSTIAVT